MAVSNKSVRQAIFFVAALSSILPLAFAGEYDSGNEERMMEKRQRHHRWFQKIDRNDNGEIGQDEFQAAAKKKFEHLDRGDDGSITLQEWRAAAKERRKERMESIKGLPK